MSKTEDRFEGLRFEELYKPQLVSILVGPNSREFAVPRSIICDRSEYFRKAFEGSYIEGRTGSIALPNVEEWVFKCFVIWLYTRKLSDGPFLPDPDRRTLDSDDDSDGEEQDDTRIPDSPDDYTINGDDWRWTWLIESYTFADEHDTKALRNNIITTIVEESTSCNIPSIGQLQHAFNNVPESSTLGRLLIDLMVTKTWPDGLDFSGMPSSVLSQVMLGLKNRQKLADKDATDCDTCRSDGWAGVCKVHSDPEYYRDTCHYHEHDADGDGPAQECVNSGGW